MISVALAGRLHERGLRWTARTGDRFIVAGRGMDADVFVVSDMTIQVHDLPQGTVIGFNGTTEWALDAVGQDNALWLPRESQLRDALGSTFRSLRRLDDRWQVRTERGTQSRVVEHDDVEEAYGLALLDLLDAVSR